MMKFRISSFFLQSPRSLASLKAQLQKGGTLKSFTVRFLIVLSSINSLFRFPVLKDLLMTAQGLLAGHVAEIELIDSLSGSKDTEILNPNLKTLPTNPLVDVLIIGSGPGAAVAAEIELGRGFQNILVVERGDVPKTSNALHHSLTHVIQDFNQAGQELVVAQGFPLYAQANVVGGGSEVNSGLYHALPEQYVKDYSKAFKVSEAAWLDSEKFIFNKLKPIKMNVFPEHSLLARGAMATNLSYGNIPRWRTYFDDGNFVHRGMNEIFWNMASENSQISLVGNLEVLKISIKKSDHLEVSCRNTLTGEKSVIKAKRVHLAAGAISTPVLLARSRIIRWRDTKFSWHPMVRVVAATKKIDLGAGDIDPFQAWTEDKKLKFGAAVSTAPLLSVALGRPVSLREASELRSYYVSFSSSGKGGLIPFLGLPWYKFSKLDRKLARDGVERLINLISAGGGGIVNPGKVSSKKYSTVHIFGTLPINGSIFVPGTNQLKADKRIRVSDASILPFGPGVNPQGVVMTAVKVANLGIPSD